MAREVYRSIYEDLLKKFYNGEYQYGEKLPPIRQLCEIYHVSSRTVNRALSLLRQKGLIRGETSNGTTVLFSHSDPSHREILWQSGGLKQCGDSPAYTVPAALLSVITFSVLSGYNEEERRAFLLEMDGILDQLEQGGSCVELVAGLMRRTQTEIKNPFLFGIFRDLMERLAVFSDISALDSQTLENFRELTRQCFSRLSVSVREKNGEGSGALIVDFYESLCRLPGVLIFSGSASGWQEMKTPRYYEIVRQVVNQILFGELKTGDHLPTESEMCKIYEVSRITVRKAYEILKEARLISSRPHLGTIVDADYFSMEVKGWLPERLKKEICEIFGAIDAFGVLCPAIARMTASRVTPEMLADMRANLEAQWNNVKTRNVPLMVTNVLITPLVQAMDSEMLDKYYLFVAAPLLRCSPISVGSLAERQSVYAATAEAIDLLEKEEMDDYYKALNRAVRQSAEIWRLMFISRFPEAGTENFVV